MSVIRKPKFNKASKKKPVAAPMNAGKVAEANQKKQKNSALVMHMAAILISGGGVLFLMLFGLQDGLKVTERCSCSWGKVAAFSAGSAFIVLLQLFTYWMYFSRCDKESRRTLTDRTRFRKKIPMLLLTLVGLPWLISAGIVYCLLPLLLDQNGNVLWMFQSGAGIGSVCLTSVVTLAIGVLAKVVMTPKL